MYAGYMDGNGVMSAEATRPSISAYGKLSIMRLPIVSSRGALVLAVLNRSDILEIVAAAKRYLVAISL